MIRVFFGDDRAGIEKEIKKILGEEYEVFDGENLKSGDMAGIFMGVSLFNTGERKILLKNLSENDEVWGKLGNYLETEHKIVIWEPKIAKTTTLYKNWVKAGIQITEMKLGVVKPPFEIIDLAIRDGQAAVKEVGKIEMTDDPYRFLGFMTTMALKRYEKNRGSVKDKKIIKGIVKLDIEMKTSKIEAWTLIKAFLLTVKDI